MDALPTSSTSPSSTSTSILKVSGTKIINPSTSTPILLRGAALGGYLNMENFITGYPGSESQHRTSLLQTLGQENYDFFFEKFYENFWTEEDAKWFKEGLGLNCLRVPIGYRVLEDDMRPRELKGGCWRWVDRVVESCAKYGIYTILDLHTCPGGQNGDWHSDNITNHASFWDHKDFQDRVVWLWREIAAHYKDNPWVAGYNPINEPCDPLHYRLPAFYDRIEAAIREVDPHHILFLDGNTFAMEWKHFEKTLPNCVYALHDYAMMGFPKSDRFVGSEVQKSKLESQFLRKAEFMEKHDTPVWNGEFGPVYADPKLDSDHEEVNSARYALLEEQLRIYDTYGIHWSIWLYKDIGLQGMTYVDPESKWMKTIERFLEKKRRLQLDAWGRRPSREVDDVIEPLVEWIDRNAPASKDRYPTPWATERQIARLVNQIWLAGSLSDEFAELFKGMSKDELEECAKSFRFDRCLQREGLNRALRAHADLPDVGKDWERPCMKREGVDEKLELD